MNGLQDYMVREYVWDYREGRLSRRDLIRRVLLITGSASATAALLGGLGLPQVAAAAPLAQATSPLSVPPNAPTIDAQDIAFEGNGTTLLAYQARPQSASGPLPLVLVCHQNRGLNEHIRDVVRRYAQAGYLASGLDLLSRQGGTATVTDPNQFAALLTGPDVDPTQFVGDFQAAVAYYQSQPTLARPDRVGMNGFCFGGGVVWRSVEAIPELVAAVPFYGAAPPLDQAANVNAAVLGVYSSDPNDFANARRGELDQALTNAGVVHQFNVYPDTHHAFNDDTGPAYNQTQALAAWKDTLAWFNQYLNS
ncbi:MAG: dienelactone hydrolase family protein [Chloroflexota bacterium]|nr:dienelactone hydrolase family protein [Chloroflexota bacterium]